LLFAGNISKSYGKTNIIRNINLNVKNGSALAVAGENGAGKTTLLKILATASMPDSGELVIDGIDAIADPAGAREKIGYVPQGIALMQELSVKDNLYYWMKKKDDLIYKRTLGIIGLEGVEKKKVSKLSGGMKRRLNIGASLVICPSLLILDEPLVGIDIANRRRIISHLSDLKKSGVTIIFTSHYIDEMNNLADELIALRNGEPTYYGSIDFSGNGRINSLSEAIKFYTA
jgi:ABC-2 type transport system ATP-binding protein